MAKELPYFQFEPAQYLTGDIQFCSLAAQGLFANICSMYWQRACDLTFDQLNKKYKEHKDLLDELVKSYVLKKDGDNVLIEFLNEQYKTISERRDKHIEAGRIGGLKSAQARMKRGPIKASPPLIKIEPDYPFKTERFKKHWIEYVSHRAKKRSKITEESAAKLFKKFKKYTEDQVCEAITLCIESGWTGVFPKHDEKKVSKIIPTDTEYKIPQNK